MRVGLARPLRTQACGGAAGSDRPGAGPDFSRLLLPSPDGASSRRAAAPADGSVASGDRFFVDALPPSGTFAAMLLTCQAGFESLLARELTERHAVALAEQGPGWVRSRRDDVPAPASTGFTRQTSPDLALLAFAHRSLRAPIEITGESVNALAQRIAEWFLAQLHGERIEGSWPSIWSGPPELVGLGRRIGAVEAAFAELLKKRFSRVAKLAAPDVPRGVVPARGLFVWFTDFGRVFVSREALYYGQRRMADDALAPSRSYLKIEEAYAVLGREPAEGETACDLGAAPGGWSYSAAKRGASVVAVDNGPLKGGALNHALILHRREDAFRFAPASGESFDWLFCDLVEEPHHVLRDLVTPWLEQRWCRRFIVNLKFGRVDPIALLTELHSPGGPLARHARRFCVRHLYHDREEFTVVGDLAG